MHDSPSIPQRDLRIDFLRGLALLRIFSAHVQGGSLIRIGFSDFAECFVFLSGYVCGLVYYRRLVNEGFLRCQARISYRAGQLYVAHVTTTLVLFGILAAVHRYEPYSFYVGALSGFERFLIAPIDTVQDVFLFKFQCGFLTILPLFIVLTLLLPTMLLIFRSGPLLMLGLSVGLYVAYQISPRWVGRLDRGNRRGISSRLRGN